MLRCKTQIPHLARPGPEPERGASPLRKCWHCENISFCQKASGQSYYLKPSVLFFFVRIQKKEKREGRQEGKEFSKKNNTLMQLGGLFNVMLSWHVCTYGSIQTHHHTGRYAEQYIQHREEKTKVLDNTCLFSTGFVWHHDLDIYHLRFRNGSLYNPILAKGLCNQDKLCKVKL